MRIARWSAVLLLCSVVFAADKSIPPIPDAISDAEYEVYIAWVKQFFMGKPATVVLDSETLLFDEAGGTGCASSVSGAQREATLPLFEAIHALGDKRYPVSIEKLKEKTAGGPLKLESAEPRTVRPRMSFHLLSFSRVAFNETHTTAVFGMKRRCGPLCGNAGYLIGTRANDEWTFVGVGRCGMVY